MRGERLSGLVRRASELTAESAGLGADRILPVLPALRDLFAGQGLRRGSTVAIQARPGATSLLLALLSAASQAGSWCAVVGVPQFGLVAANELGLVLDRVALVPYPGPQWTNVASVLLDGFDLVVVAAAGQIAASMRTQLAARARQRGSVLMPFGGWEGADVVLTPEHSAWYGLGPGEGRLCNRELAVCAGGRGSAERPRHATFWFPGPPVIPPKPTPRNRSHLTVVR